MGWLEDNFDSSSQGASAAKNFVLYNTGTAFVRQESFNTEVNTSTGSGQLTTSTIISNAIGATQVDLNAKNRISFLASPHSPAVNGDVSFETAANYLARRYREGFWVDLLINSKNIKGNISNFSGSHIALVPDTISLSIGDCIAVDSFIKVSGTEIYFICSKATSTSLTTLGTIAEINSDALGEIEKFIYEEDGSTIKSEYQSLYNEVTGATTYNYITTIGSGEAQIRVFDDTVAGDISAGDLLMVSTSDGLAIQQTDDIKYSYTIAKALEDVVWANEGGATDKTISCLVCIC